MPNPNPKRNESRFWKKGQSGNPKGSSAKSRAIAKVKRMSADDLADLTDLILRGTRSDVQAILNNEGESVIRVLTARMLNEVILTADASIYKAVLEKVVGRPRESKDVTLAGPDGQPVSMRVEEMTADEKLARAKALAKARMDAIGD